MSEDVLAAVAGLARDKLGYEGELEPGMRLVEDLELDSIRLMTLAMEIEDHFRVCLDEDDEDSSANQAEQPVQDNEDEARDRVLALLEAGANLLLLLATWRDGAAAPIIIDGQIPALMADPVPQALVLTAIVIGLGITALMLAYAYKLYMTNGTLDISRYRELKW